MTVTQKEIVEALNTACKIITDAKGVPAVIAYTEELANRIEREGIAPPDGWVLVSVQDPAVFTEWLCREMPAGTIIGDANWWAKRILRRFIPQAAAPKPEESP